MALAFHPEPLIEAHPATPGGTAGGTDNSATRRAPQRSINRPTSRPVFRPGAYQAAQALPARTRSAAAPVRSAALRGQDMAARHGQYVTASAVGRTPEERMFLRRRIAVGVLVFVFCYGLWSLFSGLASIAGASSPADIPVLSIAPQQSYTVQPGDTLWSIAGGLDTGGDLRPIVDQIAAINGGSAVLQPGDALLLPSYGHLETGD